MGRERGGAFVSLPALVVFAPSTSSRDDARDVELSVEELPHASGLIRVPRPLFRRHRKPALQCFADEKQRRGEESEVVMGDRTRSLSRKMVPKPETPKPSDADAG